ncbi:hypothetical protein URH17368_0368 [Alicyclobacillus hesperidum URH17-3-68]|nr:hypothetical protein URH17368_0368 [Alicyclobacillus hesperidum URH17-3-68]
MAMVIPSERSHVLAGLYAQYFPKGMSESTDSFVHITVRISKDAMQTSRNDFLLGEYRIRAIQYRFQ